MVFPNEIQMLFGPYFNRIGVEFALPKNIIYILYTEKRSKDDNIVVIVSWQ